MSIAWDYWPCWLIALIDWTLIFSLIHSVIPNSGNSHWTEYQNIMNHCATINNYLQGLGGLSQQWLLCCFHWNRPVRSYHRWRPTSKSFVLSSHNPIQWHWSGRTQHWIRPSSSSCIVVFLAGPSRIIMEPDLKKIRRLGNWSHFTQGMMGYAPSPRYKSENQRLQH